MPTATMWFICMIEIMHTDAIQLNITDHQGFIEIYAKIAAAVERNNPNSEANFRHWLVQALLWARLFPNEYRIPENLNIRGGEAPEGREIVIPQWLQPSREGQHAEAVSPTSALQSEQTPAHGAVRSIEPLWSLQGRLVNAAEQVTRELNADLQHLPSHLRVAASPWPVLHWVPIGDFTTTHLQSRTNPQDRRPSVVAEQIEPTLQRNLRVPPWSNQSLTFRSSMSEVEGRIIPISGGRAASSQFSASRRGRTREPIRTYHSQLIQLDLPRTGARDRGQQTSQTPQLIGPLATALLNAIARVASKIQSGDVHAFQITRATSNESTEEDMCPICRDAVDNPVVVTPCGHRFNLGCLITYMVHYRRSGERVAATAFPCPLCRTAITGIHHTWLETGMSTPTVVRYPRIPLSEDLDATSSDAAVKLSLEFGLRVQQRRMTLLRDFESSHPRPGRKLTALQLRLFEREKSRLEALRDLQLAPSYLEERQHAIERAEEVRQREVERADRADRGDRGEERRSRDGPFRMLEHYIREDGESAYSSRHSIEPQQLNRDDTHDSRPTTHDSEDGDDDEV